MDRPTTFSRVPHPFISEMASSDAELAASILKQVEFYFSDANLPKDKWVLKCLKGITLN